MIIDRFEGEYAICEDNGQMISISRSLLPAGCHEGCSITLIDGGYRLTDNTADRLRIRSKMNGLFKK